MAKNKGNGEANIADTPETAQPTTTAVVESNNVLTYRRDHPGDRCSYGVAGNAGIVVFDKGLFAGFGQPGFELPAAITISAALVPVKADNKTAKAELAAKKAEERARKAQERIEAAQKRAEEKRLKAEEALKKAQEKIAAAQASAAAN